MARSATVTKHLAVAAFLVATLLLLASPSSAQSCTAVELSLSSCLSYTTGQSNTPTSMCCTRLANVVKTSPQCLCSLAGGSAPFGIQINQTRALALPGACNVTTPPPSLCNSGGGGSPSGPGTPSTPAPATSPSAPAPIIQTPPPPPVVPATVPPPPTKSSASTSPLNAALLFLPVALASLAWSTHQAAIF